MYHFELLSAKVVNFLYGVSLQKPAVAQSQVAQSFRFRYHHPECDICAGCLIIPRRDLSIFVQRFESSVLRRLSYIMSFLFCSDRHPSNSHSQLTVKSTRMDLKSTVFYAQSSHSNGIHHFSNFNAQEAACTAEPEQTKVVGTIASRNIIIVRGHVLC